MEKKEIRKWRDRLVKMFGVYHSDGQEYVTCPLCGINLDELANHMIKELDKAREEGRREQRELDCSLYGSACVEENFDEKWKLEFGMTEEKENI